MIDISIVIPVYNAEIHLSRCLDSLFNQTVQNFEILLLNDGSTDSSYLIMQEYYAKHPEKIRLFTQENQGVTATRHRGMQEAKGTYLMFMDNDDYVDSDYVERFFNQISSQNLDCVIGGYRRASASDTLFAVKPYPNEWAKYMILTCWARIFRRDFLINNNIQFLNYGIGEDVYFNFKIYTKTTKIKVIDYVGYNWYYNEKSVSNTSHKGFNTECDDLRLLDELDNVISHSREPYYAYFYTKHIIWHLLFSGRDASYKRFMEEYQRCMNWISKNNVKFYFPVFSGKFKGELFSTRVAILAFQIINKLGLVKLFARLYAKGAEEPNF